MSRNTQLNRKKKLSKKRALLRHSRAAVEAEKSKIATIFFDESGNTGHNIVDKDQLIFTLASCKYTEKEAETLLELTNSNSPSEVHFKNLKRRKSGQDGIIRLLRHKLINRERIKVELIYKNFMVTTKIVDILIEHMMHLNGQDLYINGANIALSNMLFYCLPAFCGDEDVQTMYELFVEMVKEQSEDSITNFYQAIETLKTNSTSEDFKGDLSLILHTKHIVHDALNGIDKSSLDPSIPSLFALCVGWGDVHTKGFHIVHDDSLNIEKQKLLFSNFMDWSQDAVTLGYDRRKFKLPLKGKSLNFENSKSHPQLQVADIIASSFAYWGTGLINNEKSDYLFLELQKLNLDKFITNNKIWPTLNVTPEELGTMHDGGLNPADHGAYFLMRARSSI